MRVSPARTSVIPRATAEAVPPNIAATLHAWQQQYKRTATPVGAPALDGLFKAASASGQVWRAVELCGKALASDSRLFSAPARAALAAQTARFRRACEAKVTTAALRDERALSPDLVAALKLNELAAGQYNALHALAGRAAQVDPAWGGQSWPPRGHPQLELLVVDGRLYAQQRQLTGDAYLDSEGGGGFSYFALGSAP